jgi:hypothetical protein
VRSFRRLVLLLVALLFAVLVAQRRRPRPPLATEPATWPPLDVARRPHVVAGAVTEVDAEVDDNEDVEIVAVLDVVEVLETVDRREILEELVIVEAIADGPPATPAWVAPVDGGCPEGYPVKANSSSGIFHVPGGRSYARTKPERCYATPEDAEADGFRRAKL